jgi:toxin ParE1/3/4
VKVLFTPSAKAQFLSALEFIRRDSPLAAVRLKAQVQKSLGRLPRFPASGHPIPEFPDLPHRQVIVAPYRFFYRVEGKLIWIVANWHERQLPSQPGSPPISGAHRRPRR